MVRYPPACVNIIVICHRGAYWIPGASSGTLGVTDGLSRLFLRAATAGTSLEKVFYIKCFSSSHTVSDPGIHHEPSPDGVVEGCAVRYVQASATLCRKD